MDNEQSSLYTALAVTLDGIADADERQQVREYIKQLEAERAELRAALSWYANRDNYTAQADAHGHRQRPIMVYKWLKADEALRTRR